MRTVYIADLILTGAPQESIRNGAVVVNEGKIEQICSVEEIQNLGDGVEIKEFGEGSTLLPGLIDTHVHLAFDGSADPVERVRSADELERLAIMLKSARELLSAGVTTARDLGAPDLLDVRVKKMIDSGLARGPRMLTVTAPLTVTGGHCWFFGGECEGVDEVRRRVRQARREGADAIKIMSTGGNMTEGTLPSEPQFTLEELIAIVEEAHKYGMKVAAHAHGAEGIRRSLLAGVDTLEHFSFTTADGSMVEDAELVEQTAEKGTYVCKTICSGWGHYISEAVPDDQMRTLMDRGVQVVAGTDAGIDNTPHVDYVYGLEGMAALGMTNDEVLYSATLKAAASIGIAEETGSIEEGKSADLIVVQGDPRDDLQVLRNLKAVVAKGEEYIPEFHSETTWNATVDAPKYVPELTVKEDVISGV